MIQDIQYSGFAAVPADYECPDGQLAAAINCLPEDGAIQPLLPPSPAVVDGSYVGTPVFIHKNTGYSHILTRNGAFFFWYDFDPAARSVSGGSTLGAVPGFISAEALGNILILLTDSGMRYFLYKPDSGSYIDLGSSLPHLDVDFALVGSHNINDETFNIDVDTKSEQGKALTAWFDNPRPNTGGSRPHGSASGPAVNDTLKPSVLDAINAYISRCTAQGFFLQPFFIRYALRLFDGTNIAASPPVLLIPNSAAPVITLNRLGDESGGIRTLECSLHFLGANVFYRVISDTSVLDRWRDIVAGIDVFVSPQIYTYVADGDIDISSNSSDLPAAFTHFGPISKLNILDGPNCETPASHTNGHSYAGLSARSSSQIEKDITSQSLFYKIASIDVDDFLRDYAHFNQLEIEPMALSSLTVRPTLREEVYAHSTLVPQAAYAYNSRLSIANLGLDPFPGFSLRSMSQYSWCGGQQGVSLFKTYTIYVNIRSLGFSTWRALSPGVDDNPAVSPLGFDNLDSYFPRWLFYPDSNAAEMIIADSDGYWRLPLQPHDFITGSYWFRGLGSTAPRKIDGPVPPDILAAAASPAMLPLHNRVVVSDPGNPFVFRPEAYTSVGTGTILAIRSAARPLSQGQFGAYPLYAFTDEGVWALSVSDTGAYAARQPISRDICINTDGIAQLDSAVIFPTARGIMLISGSQTQCVSDPLNSDYPFNVLDLPGFVSLHGLLHDGDDACLPALPFTVFLKQCRMIYDYVHQRIIVYAPGVTYAYVYSLKSQQWGMTFSCIVSHLNSYPEALAVDKDNNIVNFSESDAEQVGCLYVTRPLKLGQGSMLKTIDTVIQRGNFARGHVATVLYGSRDLINWHLVWSSKDHYLRGFRGTPYKFFRIAGAANLNANENIIGASVQFTPRLTNQPR